ncbi:MAG: hypothetical protein COA79_02685 [Planctomycetota bacterium]|nr:MAG: hypothetical protein COA79_02685 [Planctomycetota bacterium]
MKVIVFLISAALLNTSVFTLEVMTFNIQKGGKKHQSKIIEIIKKSKSEIIGINEAYDEITFKKIALALNYNYYRAKTKKYQVGIFSKYPIIEKETINATSLSRSAIKVKIKLNDNTVINVFVIHLKPLNLPSRRKKRKEEVNIILQHIDKINKREPIILLGDFNERSHLDKPNKKRAVSNLIASKGFSDAFRLTHPSIKNFPGYTQSTKTFLIKRIDFIYCNNVIKIQSSKTIGKEFYKKWPSDHAAVLATVSFK